MKLSMRALAIGSFVAALAIVGVFAYPALAQDGAIDFWNVGKYHATQKAAAEIRQEMERRDELVLHRVEVREETIHDLVEGRVTFDEATARFVLLNRGATFRTDCLAKAFPGRTDEEKAAWQVVSFLGSARGQAARSLAAEKECVLLSQMAGVPTGSSAICE